MKKDLKTLLAEVKALFAAESGAPEEVAKTEVKGKDGKTYRAAKLEVGEAVEVADDAGNFSPVADGSIELEDGSTLVIVEGKISEIKPKADAAPEEDQAHADATPSVTVEQFNDLVGRFDALVKVVESLVTGNTASAAQYAAKFDAMLAAIDAIADEPEATPTDKPKSNAFAKASKKDEAFAVLKNVINASRKK